jgi:uncharacterized protein (TIGR00255 family)
MIRSMTGYAAASADSPRGTVGVELRSVNSRFLDLAFRIAEELRALEPGLREMLGARLSRGKVECRLYLGSEGAHALEQRLDSVALDRLQGLAAQARRAFPDAAPLRVADVLRWPGVVAEPAIDEEGIRALARDLCATALGELVAAREREGARLAAAITERVAEMRQRVRDLEPLLPEALSAYEAKLGERLREALGGTQDPERLRAEVALFAAKSDVDEEMTRLRTHLDEVDRTLKKGGAAGKRLDFLAQELNREANTLASKAASQAISDCALELKLLVEQIREQVQNIE